MRSALKNVASVILGFIVASVVMMLVEMLNGHVLYPELSKAARAATSPEAVRALMATVPTGAMVVVLVTFLPILAAYYLTRDGDQIGGHGK